MASMLLGTVATTASAICATVTLFSSLIVDDLRLGADGLVEQQVALAVWAANTSR